MRYVTYAFLYAVNFLISFVFGGLVLMPHLPPYPPRPVSAFEAEFWTTNWAGALLGILTVGFSIWRERRKARGI